MRLQWIVNIMMEIKFQLYYKGFNFWCMILYRRGYIKNEVGEKFKWKCFIIRSEIFLLKFYKDFFV